MKRTVLVLLAAVLAIGFSACGSFNAEDLFNGEIRFGLRQGSIQPRLEDKTVSIIRAYPSSTITLSQGRDSVYNLRSGDRLSVIWKPTGDAIMFCDITADTVSFVRK